MLVTTPTTATALLSVPELSPPIPITSVDSWAKFNKAGDASSLVPLVAASALKTLRYLGGDYWQNWDCWVGTQIPPDAKNRETIVAAIEKSHVPRPLIEEMTDRHVSGLVGQEPAFEFVSMRDSRLDDDALDAFEEIKEIVRERDRRRAQRKAQALADPGAPAPTPEELAAKAAEEELAADAWDQFDISRAMAKLQTSLGLEVEDDFVIPDDLPDDWKAAIKKAKQVRKDIDAERAFIERVNGAFGAWWDKRKGHELLQDFTRLLIATGRASLRFYVPTGFVTNGELNVQLKATEWEKALDLIYLEVPEPGSGTVAINRSKRAPASIYAYTGSDEKGEDLSCVEVTFLDEDGKTVIRILHEDVILENGEADHDCAGELFLDEATAPPLISEALRRNQDALNVINTMLLHNGNLAGHRQRDYFNVIRPTREIPDPLNPGKMIKINMPVGVGPGTANFHTGITYKDDNGKTNLAPGAMVITDPVDPKPLIDAISQFEDNMYATVGQRHVKISGDATASAVSRVQARYEFLAALRRTRPKIEGVVRSRMRGVVALAMSLAKANADLEKLKLLRASVVCHLNTGPLTPDERRQVLSEYEKKVIPLETAQILLQYEDVAALSAQLREEEETSSAALSSRVEAFVALVGSGIGIEEAALTAGFDPKTAKRMAESKPAETPKLEPGKEVEKKSDPEPEPAPDPAEKEELPTE